MTNTPGAMAHKYFLDSVENRIATPEKEQRYNYLRRFGEKVFEEMKERLMVGMGQNAGVVDVGEGWAVTFKAESHNHPSFIEPFQGAATGVGGIVRDIISMGARPVAVMDALRFGAIDHPDTARVVHGGG